MKLPDVKTLTSDTVQRELIAMIFERFMNNHDDYFDMANWAAALSKASDAIWEYTLKHGAGTLSTDEINQMLEDAMQDWPTVYEKWLADETHGLGGFQTLIFKAYREASNDNKDKLRKTYPEWFTITD